jgi:protoheme IX farnesyltransferase
MQDQHASIGSRMVTRIGPASIGVAAGAFALALYSGFFATAPAVMVRALALALLGAALAVYTNVRLGPVSTLGRLGGRAQQVQRRYRALVAVSVLIVYVVLLAGTLTTDTRALWSCQTLPLCTPSNTPAIVALAHRSFAAFATVLVAALAYRTWKVRSERSLRYAAAGALVLMLLGNALGMLQVVSVQTNVVGSTLGIGMVHVALSTAVWATLVVLATIAVRPPVTSAAGVNINVPAADPAAKARTPSRFRDYLSLTKPGVISLLIFTTFAAMFITPAGTPSFWTVVWTLIGGWLMPAGAHALNCYFDRDIDVKMGRTGRRPLPSQRIPAWHALLLGITLAMIAFAVLAFFVNLLTAGLALFGFFYYVVIYTLWLKRATPSNIVIGGGAGAVPPLVGWAAGSGELTIGALLLFALIYLWTPPHFWALALIRQKDYANAGVPMLPVVAGDDETKRQIVRYGWQMMGLSLILTPLHVMGWAYFIMAAVLGAIFMYYAVRLQRSGTTADAWKLYKYSLLYLFLLFVAMMIDRLVFV